MIKLKQGSIKGREKGKKGVDSTQHMLHCMSQYNSSTTNQTKGHMQRGARTMAGAQLNRGATKGKGKL